MKILKSNTGKDILVDDEDYEYLSKLNWNDYSGYLRTYNRKNGVFSARVIHRIIMGVENTSLIIDHIDGNPFNNQKSNLRVATTSENGGNRKLNKTSLTGYKGVTYHKRDKRYQASIRYQGKRLHLGYFLTAEDAAKAYDVKAKELFKEFALPNFKEDN